MRIVYFEKYLEESIENLKLELSSSKGQNNTEYNIISNWKSVCNTMCSLEEVDFIKPLLADIFAMGVHFKSPTSSLSLDKGSFNKFKALHQKLIDTLNAMYSMGQAFFPKDDENQLNIKLPDNMTLAEMSKYIEDIDFIFNKMQALKKINDNNDFTLKRVDAGSVWLILLVAIPTAITTVGAIVKLSMDIKRHLIDDEITKQKLRALKSGADMIEKIEGELSEALKNDCTEKAKTFNDDHKLELGSEEITTLSIGIERLGNLLFKGVEIYASLEAPNTVTSAFPVQESSPLLNAAKRLLLSPDKES